MFSGLPGLQNYPITRFPDYPISAPYPLPVDPNGPNAYWTSEGCIPMRSNVYWGFVIRPRVSYSARRTYRATTFGQSPSVELSRLAMDCERLLAGAWYRETGGLVN